MKLFLRTAALLACTTLTQADIITETYGPSVVNTAIADNQSVLSSFLLSVNSSVIQSLTQVTISFELRGTTADAGWAGDIFASLLKSPVGIAPTVSDTSAVLLNRVGVTASEAAGYGHDGWNITLSDTAASDIHGETVGSGLVTGTFQPDGRLAATDTLRPALLGAFNGAAGNGDWRFNVADLAAVGTMRLVSWSLTLTGEYTPVPESGTQAAGLGLAALAAVTVWRRQRRP
jgi:MYXO-CTERM domain-containing protein